MKLKCDCCRFEQEFKDGEEAFQAGWDAPPHFTGYVCCNLCPATALMLREVREVHLPQHAKWILFGRSAYVTPEADVIANAIAKVWNVLGRDHAKLWLETPVRALGYVTPLSLLGTPEGALRVIAVLDQLEHGIW